MGEQDAAAVFFVRLPPEIGGTNLDRFRTAATVGFERPHCRDADLSR